MTLNYRKNDQNKGGNLRLSIVFSVLLCCCSSGLFAQATSNSAVVPSPIAALSQKIATANTLAPLTEDELFQVQQNYTDAISQKRFEDALALVERIPTKDLSRQQKEEKVMLRRFRDVETQVSQSSSLFQKDDELDDTTRKAIQRLYRETQSALMNQQTDLARDLMIHTLFLHRQNLRAKTVLEDILELRTGSYKVENMEEKYWKQSSILFYGGNYAQAVEVLRALSFFSKDNPVVYERMGSCYYMLGESQNAISAWNTAIFLNPDNKELQPLITKVQKLMEEEKAREKEKKKTVRETKKVPEGELQLMGMFPTQNRAYDFASKLRTQGMDPIVTEEDSGKWSVKILKTQVKSGTAQ
jgi:tetratricopeptide (TPR) repeat protein